MPYLVKATARSSANQSYHICIDGKLKQGGLLALRTKEEEKKKGGKKKGEKINEKAQIVQGVKSNCFLIAEDKMVNTFLADLAFAKATMFQVLVYLCPDAVGKIIVHIFQTTVLWPIVLWYWNSVGQGFPWIVGGELTHSVLIDSEKLCASLLCALSLSLSLSLSEISLQSVGGGEGERERICLCVCTSVRCV